MNPFSELPDNFFVPLAFKNREHYACLLLVFFDLFLEYPTGVEREIVINAFEEYFVTLDREQAVMPDSEPDEEEEIPEEAGSTLRGLASLFVRKLVRYGWISEEILPDYTQIINICSWAKPFIQALLTISMGNQVEYESHVVAIYSSICSDSVEDNGHHAVLNAHYHTRLLIESLKVLAQNIKNHVQNIFNYNADIKDLLHIHYDIYMHEVIDKAYTRLKTSDNLSKYRPKINRKISGFLKNRTWLEKTSDKLSIIKHRSREESMKLLVSMLNEIRSELRNIDPILEEIDDKNRRYSSISTERIKTKLYTDHSLHGKIKEIIKAIIGSGGNEWEEMFSHRVHRNRFLSNKSLYSRPAKNEEIILKRIPDEEDFDIEMLQTELMLKITNQLNPEKITKFLDNRCRRDGTPTPAGTIIENMESFVKTMYAALYAESREELFPYRVVWEEKEVVKERFVFKNHYFIKRHS